MPASPIRNMRILHTYLQHPKNPVERHMIVSTSKDEGYRPENNYTDRMETAAFPTWNIGLDSDTVFETAHHSSEGVYEAHYKVLKDFLGRGWKKIKTTVQVIPEGHETVAEYTARPPRAARA